MRINQFTSNRATPGLTKSTHALTPSQWGSITFLLLTAYLALPPQWNLAPLSPPQTVTKHHLEFHRCAAPVKAVAGDMTQDFLKNQLDSQ